VYNIIASSITALIALIICLLNNSYQMKQFDKKYSLEQEQMHSSVTEQQKKALESLKGELADMKQHLEVITYKVDELGKKQDKYNHLQERTYTLEGKSELVLEKIDVANHRIEDLENHEVEILKKLKGVG